MRQPKNTIEEKFANLFCRMARPFGIKDNSLKIVAYLYLEPEEISMEELAKKAGYSLASVSTLIQSLEELGIVERLRKPGTKKVFLYMQKDLVKINMIKLERALEYVKSASSELPSIIKDYSVGLKPGKSKKKHEIMENYYKELQNLESVLIKWKKDLEDLRKK